jgi:hypothetical protein
VPLVLAAAALVFTAFGLRGRRAGRRRAAEVTHEATGESAQSDRPSIHPTEPSPRRSYAVK